MTSPEPNHRVAAITALGMATAVGDGAPASCAALRAGITRLAELEGIELELDGGRRVKAIGSAASPITGGLRGSERLAALAGAALDELAREQGLDALSEVTLRLALPPRDRPDQLAGSERALLDALGTRDARGPLASLSRRTELVSAGHAGLGLALIAALEDLARGAERVLVGGVDSLLDPAALCWFHAQGRLALGSPRVGFFPGEGAALLVLEPVERALARGATIFALLEAPATAEDPVHAGSDVPCDGRGLSTAIEATLAGSAEAIGDLYVDLNGEPFRSEELALALVRSLRHAPKPRALTHLADCIGDTGAASMAIALCAGAMALRRGHTSAGSVLVTASSDMGLKASARLRAHPGRAA